MEERTGSTVSSLSEAWTLLIRSIDQGGDILLRVRLGAFQASTRRLESSAWVQATTVLDCLVQHDSRPESCASSWTDDTARTSRAFRQVFLRSETISLCCNGLRTSFREITRIGPSRGLNLAGYRTLYDCL